jgi:hypothetical protein
MRLLEQRRKAGLLERLLVPQLTCSLAPLKQLREETDQPVCNQSDDDKHHQDKE